MKSLLLTGASGFVGKNVLPVLKQGGSIVSTLDYNNSDYNCDLSQEVPELGGVFNIVLHAAGKAHFVPETPEEEKSFFAVNLQGTKNLCTGLEKAGVPGSFIFLSTVAVYGLDRGNNITEDYPLKGRTPYALSKIQTEQFLKEWCDKKGVILSIIRPSLIAGPNPPGNLGSMIQALKKGRYFSISGGKSRKSALMVQDIAALVPFLAAKGGIYNVCDNTQPTFREFETLITLQLGKSVPPSIPYWFARFLAWIGDFSGAKMPINSEKLDKIVNPLTFSNAKARRELGWEPLSVLENFLIE
jgi:GlcNAc-P-P-Und epimerase